MAIIEVTYPEQNFDGIVLNDTIMLSWVLGSGDSGSRVKSGNYADKTVQFVGTFGGSVSLRGSNMVDPDPENASHWFSLTDAAGNVVGGTSGGGSVVMESTLWISPLVVGGDGSTAISVLLLAKKQS